MSSEESRTWGPYLRGWLEQPTISFSENPYGVNTKQYDDWNNGWIARHDHDFHTNEVLIQLEAEEGMKDYLAMETALELVRE